MKKLRAALFAFLMMTMSLAGCLSGDAGEDGEDGKDGAEGVAGPAGEDGSSLHMVVSSAELPDCDSAHLGHIYFVSADGAFQVCSTTGWAVVDLTGPPGADGLNGTNGTDGVNGANGADGADGARGANGTDGLAALAVTTALTENNSSCPDGGIQIDVGIDEDESGSLEAVEIDQTSYICNGADGTDGSASTNTMLTSISSPPASMGCTAGGRVMLQGLDNGDGGGTAQNGVLEYGEVDYKTNYCSKYTTQMMSDINSGHSSGDPGSYMEVLVGDTIYFDADDSDELDDRELWAHDTSNLSTWQVADIRMGTYFGSSGPGYHMEILVGDTIYFDAYDVNTGRELWAHDASNHSTWQVTDIRNGSGSSNPGRYMLILVGDTIYFDAYDGKDGFELWAMKIEHSITYN